MNELIDCHNHVGADLGVYLRGEFPYGQHAEALFREGRALGVGKWIVFPMVAHLALNAQALSQGRVTTEGAWERVPYAWENRRLMQEIHEFFPQYGADMLPFAMFDPMREPEAQAEALRALRLEFPFYGLKTQPTMLQSPITHLNERGRVFLDLAREWDFPLLIHSSVLPADVWSQASDIIDIAAANPDLRFCVAHSCRFDREQLDRINALPNCWYDCSAHGIHCELALQNSPVVAPASRRFDSDYSRPGQVLLDMAQAYPGKLMWGSDSPFYSFIDSSVQLVSSYELEVDYLKALPAEVQHEIGTRNTLQLLGLPYDS